MTEEKKSFIVYTDWKEYFEDVSDAELGRLFKALFSYALEGVEPEFTGAMRPIFRMMRNCLIRDGAKWEEKCRRNSENGRKGALAKAENMRRALANSANAKNAPANLADSESVNDSVNDSGSESESVKDREKGGFAASASPSPSPSLALGEYCNVFISQEDYNSLTEEFGKTRADNAIEEISEYCDSVGKTYKNWKAAIRRWIKRDDRASEPAGKPRPNYHRSDAPSYDLDDFMKLALTSTDIWEAQQGRYDEEDDLSLPKI